MNNAKLVKDILVNEDITTWFQPIINIQSNKLVGWEGLTRGPSISPLHSAPALFKAAHEAKMLKPLELMCIKNATRSFEQLTLGGKVFINISHELFLAGNHLRKQLKELAANGPVSPSKIILELTEQGATTNLDKLTEAAEFFHSLGFQIAIDDLGIGEISHDQWMQIEPDYVKVARQYINGIDKDDEKLQLVKSVVSAARSSQAKVIALGVETQEELNTIRSLGIPLCEGYIFGRPQLSPEIPDLSALGMAITEEAGSDEILACDLVVNQEKVTLDTPIKEITGIFESHIAFNSIAVVAENEIVGLVKRTAFLEALKRHEFSEGASVKSLEKLIERDFTLVDSYMKLDPLSKLLIGRARTNVHDDFVVTTRGKYLGTSSIVDVMRQLIVERKSA